MVNHLRIARPVSNLARSVDMYCRGLDYAVLGTFEDHAGYDGVMVGAPGAAYHIEFTHCREEPVTPAPTAEDLTVFYIPGAEDWESACRRMVAAGFRTVAPVNPYWDLRGRTFEDGDGYRVVLQNAEWSR